MNNKKDVLPIVIASVIALLITGVVKWIIPSSSKQTSHENSKNDISMPEIPLMVKVEKKQEKKIEQYVLIVSNDIKKDQKINANQFKWEKWPENAMQSYFIAKDEKGTPLNNGSDYKNALSMWAKADIQKGIPLVMSMLTNVDPKKKVEEEKKKAEEERRKAEIAQKQSYIKKGMRAVTFPIDQKTAVSSNMFMIGDLIDVLIVEQSQGKTKTHKYKALKILAVDGFTKIDKNESASKHSNGLLSGISSSVNSFLTPKNITLEVKEELVEVMLKQANSSGVILSLRSQHEPVETEDTDEDLDDESGSNAEAILSSILKINKSNPTDVMLEEKAKKEEEKQDMLMLMNSMNMANSFDKPPRQSQEQPADADGKKQQYTSKDSKYEIVSGKIVGEEPKEDSKSIVIYRKLTPTSVNFNDEGKIVTGGGTGSATNPASQTLGNSMRK